MKHLLLCIALLLTGSHVSAQSEFADIVQLLADAPVQEKVYLHLDNTCYFKGDTIWYKSYVVRADSLTYSDMSHIVYVELVSPDGLVVERQQLIASAKPKRRYRHEALCGIFKSEATQEELLEEYLQEKYNL